MPSLAALMVVMPLDIPSRSEFSVLSSVHVEKSSGLLGSGLYRLLAATEVPDCAIKSEACLRCSGAERRLLGAISPIPKSLPYCLNSEKDNELLGLTDR